MSILDVLEPVLRLMPEVKTPETLPSLQKRLLWTASALLFFFVMGQIALLGIDTSSAQAKQLQAIQIILASPLGTLISAGIGPIVLASIILQLLVGGGILKVDLSQPADKAKFTQLQKLLAIILSFFEAGAYTGFGMFPGFIVPLSGMVAIVILQIAFGSIILMYLDELVTKYGIGSGIGLFIAAGVAQHILWTIFRPANPLSGDLSGGLLFQVISTVGQGQIFQALILFSPVIFTVIVFFVVVFAEGMHVNIPLAYGVRGAGGRYPVKLLYVSNIPVILAAALFANFQLWAALTEKIPFIGSFIGSLAAITRSPPNLIFTIMDKGFMVALPDIGLALAYLIVLIATCVIFGKLWVELGGQGSGKIAEQIADSGMYIPGFRKDKRIIQEVLDRYIPTIVILGSAFVGLLAGAADLTGALGTGTGILLTVGIIYKLYEEMEKAQLFAGNDMLKKFIGGS